MGITERVANMTVRVSSPNGGIFARLDGRESVQLSFAPGYYERAAEHDLESQLTQVARLLWTSRMRAYNAIIADEYQESLIIDPKPQSQLDREFYDQRDNLLAVGRSADGRIEVSVRGMRDWKVRLAPGTAGVLSEEDFARAAATAATQLISDQRDKVRELKIEIFAPEFVADFKE
jgi:hypothetical protein